MAFTLVLCQALSGGAARSGASEKSASLTVLSYNVHGTYVGYQVPFTWKTRTSRFPWIGRLTGRYDVVLLQEFFRDAEDLYRAHLLESSPHKIQILAEGPLGRFYDSGLAVLADHERLKHGSPEYFNYTDCEGLLWDLQRGSDCLAQKGVLFVPLEFLGGSVHFYDTHLDSAGTEGDQTARVKQLRELENLVVKNSPSNQAVILAGDFNTRLYGKQSRDQQALDSVRKHLKLNDTCKNGYCRSKAKGCGLKKRIDYIFYRSGSNVELEPKAVGCAPLRRPEGRRRNLSDHPALSVTFEVTVTQHRKE